MKNEFDVIVLGATFAAVGLAQSLGERCLIVEPGPQAGCEFLGALHYGDGYELPLQSEAARQLRREFEACGAFADGRICLFECAALLYRRLQEKNVLLNTAVAEIKKEENGFCVTTLGVSGFRRFFAKMLIDTRVQPQQVAAKTFNALIAPRKGLTDAALPEDLPPDVDVQLWGHEGDRVIRCPVAADAALPQARAALAALLQKLPQHRLLMMAEDFACAMNGQWPLLQENTALLPSCAARNPLAAFDAGVMFGEEVLRHAAF